MVQLPDNNRRSGFALLELMAVIAIIGVLVALLLPAGQAARESARRAAYINNLKQLGLAAHNFESQHGCMPRAGTAGENYDDLAVLHIGVNIAGSSACCSNTRQFSRQVLDPLDQPAAAPGDCPPRSDIGEAYQK